MVRYVMANVAKKRQENVAGEFFVDEQCISCGACWAAAPEFFFSHPIHTYAFVYKQPTDTVKQKLCQSVLEICPVEAIGKCT